MSQALHKYNLCLNFTLRISTGVGLLCGIGTVSVLLRYHPNLVSGYFLVRYPYIHFHFFKCFFYYLKFYSYRLINLFIDEIHLQGYGVYIHQYMYCCKGTELL